MALSVLRCLWISISYIVFTCWALSSLASKPKAQDIKNIAGIVSTYLAIGYEVEWDGEILVPTSEITKTWCYLYLSIILKLGLS